MELKKQFSETSIFEYPGWVLRTFTSEKQNATEVMSGERNNEHYEFDIKDNLFQNG